MGYAKCLEVIESSVDSSFLYIVLQSSANNHDSGFIKLLALIVDIISDFFYFEAKQQVVWLTKLDLVKALANCNPALQQMQSFCMLLQNMMCLQNEELQGTR